MVVRISLVSTKLATTPSIYAQVCVVSADSHGSESFVSLSGHSPSNPIHCGPTRAINNLGHAILFSSVMFRILLLIMNLTQE
jgi:hypothetical protein